MHAIRTVYEEQSAKAVLLVEVSNTFSSVNRNAFLHNVEIACLSAARYLRNCYSLSTRLFIIGVGEI